MTLRVYASERRSSHPGPQERLLPASLQGHDCHSAAVGEYTLSAEQAILVTSRVSRLEPSQMSANSIEVLALDGGTMSYVGRDVFAKAAEQAGTFPDALPTTRRPRVQTKMMMM